MSEFTLSAELREEAGKGASRRLRREGQIPGILYGSGEPVSISVNGNELYKAMLNGSIPVAVIHLAFRLVHTHRRRHSHHRAPT